MRDKVLYTQISGIRSPWKVPEVELAVEDGEVKVFVAQEAGVEKDCPTCGQSCPGYDRRRCSWLHLDACRFKTILVAEVPRIKCPDHAARS